MKTRCRQRWGALLTGLATLAGSAGLALGALTGQPAAQAAAAAAVPWTCSTAGLLFQSPNGNNSTPHTVQRIDLTTGANTQIGTTADSLNAVGYNTLDNFVYGWDHTTSQLVRVNGDMTLTQMGLPAGLPNSAYNTGDFDPAGHLWLANGNATPPIWREVDFAPGSSTFGQVIGSGNLPTPTTVTLPSDWSYIPGRAPVGFYGVGVTSSGTGSAHLWYFNPADGSMTDLGGVPGLPSTSAYGATYSDESGYLYAANNASGIIYRVDPSTVTQITLSHGPTAVNNDGARCLMAGAPTVTLAKSVGGRLQPADQFTVTLADAGGAPLTSATTSGTDTAASTTNWPVATGSSYHLTEAMAPGSPSPLTGYNTSISCTDSTTGANVPVSGSSPNWTLDVPGTDNYLCTISNSPNVQPGISLVKTASPVTVESYTLGQLITYTYVATNTGNVPLTDVTVNETPGGFTGSGMPPQVQCPETPASLDPGAQLTCTATYTLTQPDIDNGEVGNTATATGTPPSGTPITSPPSSTVIPSEEEPSITVHKTVTPTTVTAAGQTVSYSYLVTNTGNVTLTGVGVVEDATAFTGTGPLPVVSCPGSAASLDPGAQVTCTATYTVTQQDVDNGGFSNTASANGTDPTGTPVESGPSTSTVTATRSPALGIAKTASPTSVTAVGSTITYTFDITNTGNTTLGNVTAVETASNRSGPLSTVNCPAGAASLAPGATVTCTATYQVTAEDLTQASLTDSAVANGTDPNGNTVASPPSSAVVGVGTAAITLTKSADPLTVTAAGQTVTYSFTVNNTGTVPLTGIVVNETAFSGSGGSPQITCPTDTLASGTSMTCNATYTVTQQDIAAGQITNTATATGTAPDGPTVTSPQTGATVTVQQQAASLSLAKTASPSTVSAAGQTVAYTFTVTNTGQVALTDVAVNETDFSGSGGPLAITCQSTTLDAGASMTCDASYTVTQQDIAAGRITNTATATGTDPSGNPVTSPQATVTVGVLQAVSLALTKTASPTTVSAAGQTVDYSFTVTNTGQAPVSNVAVNETAFSGSGGSPQISCPSTGLAVGASVTCTATYTTTEADQAAGRITNTATAAGTSPDGSAVTSPPASATVTFTGVGQLTLEKSGKLIGGNRIRWTFTVTNPSNVTITDITIDDPTVGKICCPRTTLAPGASVTCTVTRRLTKAELAAGYVENTATAHGQSPSGPVQSAPAHACVPVPCPPKPRPGPGKGSHRTADLGIMDRNRSALSRS